MIKLFKCDMNMDTPKNNICMKIIKNEMNIVVGKYNVFLVGIFKFEGINKKMIIWRLFSYIQSLLKFIVIVKKRVY